MAWKHSTDVQRVDVHQTVTNQIVAMLESGVKPWSRSWNGDDSPLMRPLRANGEPYHGINVLILWATAMARGYTSAKWMTFKQAHALGGSVRKGERGVQITYYQPHTVADNVTGEERSIPVLRAFTVFNIEQIADLPNALEPVTEAADIVSAPLRIEQVDAFFARINIDIRHGGGRAFYLPSQDRVHMPQFRDFHTPVDYYTTLAHEAVHWTGHESRLDRKTEGRWGDDSYAVEELVAEMGAAYLAADLGLSVHAREDHASYLDNWLRVLKSDKRAIFTAASAAEKAVTYLHECAKTEYSVVHDEREVV